ncbi:DUF2071 domain-containing protein [Paenibacillus sp. M1]|uniref:DUF2071 domain-containing protein n=1 Tax=Paenibacillus haidiansis TaxID=1574488 RepID=A0ABU7VPF2_9BACL
MAQNEENQAWDAGHRLWPLPKLPWIMRQSWTDVLFIHYPIRIDVLRNLVPAGLQLDAYDGWGWIGLVLFNTEKVSFRGIPAFYAFPELNIRTYVRTDGKPGVYFFSLDAMHWPTVILGRIFCHLPYSHANMTVRRNGESITFGSRRKQEPSIGLNCSYRFTSTTRPDLR